jgi:hypothetical protein
MLIPVGPRATSGPFLWPTLTFDKGRLNTITCLENSLQTIIVDVVRPPFVVKVGLKRS